MSKMLTKAEKMKIIAQKVTSAAGRAELAGSMQQPLREYRDYSAVGRRALLVDELPQGVEAYYDKDPDLTSYVVGEEGEDILQIVRGERVHVPLFEIATLPQIPITQIRQRRYDINARVKVKVNSEVMRVEDGKIFGAIMKVSAATGAGNDEITVTRANLTIETISDAIALIERHGDIKCTNIFMNAKNNTVLRKINKDYYIDFETSKELLRNGYIGNIYGSQIHNSSVIPEDTILFTGEPEFLGRLVNAIDLTVINADDPQRRVVGFSIYEQIGILISNPNAIAAIKIS